MKFFLYILYTLERKKGRVRKYEYEYNENMKKGHGWENAEEKNVNYDSNFASSLNGVSR